MKNFFEKLELLIDDLFYETKEPVKNKEILLLARKLKKFRKTGASLETMLDVAMLSFCGCKGTAFYLICK